MDPLEVTDDQRELSPVEALAEIMAGNVDERMTLSTRDRQILEELSAEIAFRLAEIHARMLAGGNRIPVRVHQLEEFRTEIQAWRADLTGKADTNGRIGRLGDTVREIREDIGPREFARRDRAELRRQRKWTRAAVAAIAAAVLAIAGAGRVWMQNRDLRTASAAAQEQRIKALESIVNVLLARGSQP